MEGTPSLSRGRRPFKPSCVIAESRKRIVDARSKRGCCAQSTPAVAVATNPPNWLPPPTFRHTSNGSVAATLPFLTCRSRLVDVRERFAIPESALPKALARLKRIPGLTEGLIVSTCNRTEFYVTGEFRHGSAPAFFESFYQDFRAGDETHLFRLWANHCVRHLFQVASGLESMVVGETENFGQVKRAYEFATGAKTTGKLLNRLFQKSFHVAKQVRSSTAITRGSVSVGSVAVDLAEQIFGDLDGCKIMILGAGETSEKTAKAFRSRGVEQIFVSNRSFERAQALATITGGRAIHFEDWEQEFRDLDILVSSTAAPHAIITVDKLAPFLRGRRHRPLFMIDLAMPRDIDPAVRKLDGVYLYDLDSLQRMAERTLAVRKQVSEKCHHLIEHRVQDFQRWIERTQSPNFPSIVIEFHGAR
jgi:glutamyl-tRNA reductase